MAVNRSRRPYDPKKRMIAFLITLAVIAAVYFFAPDVLVDLGIIEPVAGFSRTPSPTAAPEQSSTEEEDALRAYIIDVGQGDSILLVSPSGKTMLVDAGESGSFENIDALLAQKQIETLDVVVATHPHSDHIGGMTKVINKYTINDFYLPDIEHTTSAFANMLEALSDHKVKVHKAQGGKDALISWDPQVEVRILSPLAGGDYGDDLNAWSIVLRVKFGDTAILLTGDAEAPTESFALNSLPASYFKATVLKLGHHGSSTSTSEAFLKAVSPEIAVASLGKDNDYGHPHAETLALLARYDIPLYRTDESGTIEVVLDGSKASVTTAR
ncbi:MAG: ComEC/Rec2 family competence protein [Bacillota bacterium]